MSTNSLFLIIGAQRSGTTYLYTLLDEHPEICMAKPLKPEPRFFLSEDYQKGLNYYFTKYYPHKNNKHKVFIEKSTTYCEFELVPKRLVYDNVNAKIIFIIRNPAERAISNYLFSKKNKLETRSLEDVFINNTPAPEIHRKISTNPFDYLERGKYIKYIKLYLRYIPKENFNIICFNDLIGNIIEIQKLYSLLNVAANFIPPSLTEKVNRNKNSIKVPGNIISMLNNYYLPFNKELEDFLGRKMF